MQLFLLPYSMKYRSLYEEIGLIREFHSNYFLRIVTFCLLSLPLGLSFLLTYSYLVISLPINVFFSVSLYWLLTHISFSWQDYLQVVNRHKLDAVVSLVGFLVQLVSLFLLLHSKLFSIFTSILFSLCANSMTRIVTTFYVFIHSKQHMFDGTSKEPSVLGLPKYLPITSPSMIEIYVKLLIGFLLPLDMLAKYSLIVAVFMPIRMFIDSLVRYKMKPYFNLSAFVGRRRVFLSFFSVCIFLLGASWLINRSISAMLGIQWVLPILTTWTILVYEFSRNLFYFHFGSLLAYKSIPWNRKLLLASSFFTLPLTIHGFGLVGATTLMTFFILSVMR